MVGRQDLGRPTQISDVIVSSGGSPNTAGKTVVDYRITQLAVIGIIYSL